MLNIILWLSIIWLAPLMCFVLANEAKFKKNIAVGVTLPYEGRHDPLGGEAGRGLPGR